MPSVRPAGVQKLQAEVYMVRKQTAATVAGHIDGNKRRSAANVAVQRARSLAGSRVTKRQTTHARASLLRLSRRAPVGRILQSLQKPAAPGRRRRQTIL
jgi:hypothetical protein